MFTVSVGVERNEEAAKRIESYSEVESVKLAANGETLDVKLKDGHEDGTFLPERLIADSSVPAVPWTSRVESPEMAAAR